MQPKLCLCLAGAVVIGALCTGNPFLPDAPRARAGGAPPPTALPATAVDAVRERGAALAADGRPLPACPDAQLDALVCAVEFLGDEPVWTLHDGRRIVRNPRPGPGEPLVVDWTPDDDG